MFPLIQISPSIKWKMDPLLKEGEKNTIKKLPFSYPQAQQQHLTWPLKRPWFVAGRCPQGFWRKILRGRHLRRGGHLLPAIGLCVAESQESAGAASGSRCCTSALPLRGEISASASSPSPVLMPSAFVRAPAGSAVRFLRPASSPGRYFSCRAPAGSNAKWSLASGSYLSCWVALLVNPKLRSLW